MSDRNTQEEIDLTLDGRDMSAKQREHLACYIRKNRSAAYMLRKSIAKVCSAMHATPTWTEVLEADLVQRGERPRYAHADRLIDLVLEPTPLSEAEEAVLAEAMSKKLLKPARYKATTKATGKIARPISVKHKGK